MGSSAPSTKALKHTHARMNGERETKEVEEEFEEEEKAGGGGGAAAPLGVLGHEHWAAACSLTLCVVARMAEPVSLATSWQKLGAEERGRNSIWLINRRESSVESRLVAGGFTSAPGGISGEKIWERKSLPVYSSSTISKV